ncbi:hypothetical protein IMSAG013_00542 [Clostridiales bacterium]|jgi:hypothetical protein|nr:hypothetical protein [Clostridiales bacterium]GFI55497.1 hypothetical protein IMSAG013_00542 [Clostridiales bacterium]
MKKRWVAIGMLLLTLCLSACSVRDTTGETTAETTQADITQENTTSPVTTEETTSAPDDTSADSTDSEGEKQITEEEALAAAKAYMGDTDPDTGYKYSFVSEGIMQDTDTGEEYYKVRVSWYLPEDDRYSVYGHLLVTKDGKSILNFD